MINYASIIMINYAMSRKVLYEGNSPSFFTQLTSARDLFVPFHINGKIKH